jgi:hypothetical protein
MIPTEKKPEEKSNLFQKLALLIPVWVQMIICAGAVMVAFINSPVLIEKFFASPTSTPTLASATVFPATDAMMTQPPIVAASATPTLIPGEDWSDDCINSAVWNPYLAGETRSEQSQCHQLSEWGIKAEQGRLIFASNRYSQPRANEYGILTPWNNWREVDFTVVADRQENSEIWFGFFEGDTLNSNGIVFVIQPGDEIDVRVMPYETEAVNNIDLKYADGKFHPRIIFEGGKIGVWVDQQDIITKWPVNFQIRNMFVGYRALPSANLNVAVFDLKFKP